MTNAHDLDNAPRGYLCPIAVSYPDELVMCRQDASTWRILDGKRIAVCSDHSGVGDPLPHRQVDRKEPECLIP